MMKKIFTIFLALTMVVGLLAGCGKKNDVETGESDSNKLSVVTTIFPEYDWVREILGDKAESTDLTMLLSNGVDLHSYQPTADDIVKISDCDLFISAAPKQMNAMDGSLMDDAEKNPDGLDLIVTDSRIDLLENKVALAVPEGNPKGIESFDQLAELLKSGDVFLAMGNSDVPVGQYTQKIFAYYGLDEAALNEAGVLTYGSDVKEVTTQVSEGAVDCGITVDGATAEMCGQVIYPAAVVASSQHPDEAQAFLDYLTGDEADAVFESVGFTPIA